MSRALYDILLGLLRASRRGQTPPTLLFIGFDRALNVEPEQKGRKRDSRQRGTKKNRKDRVEFLCGAV